MVVGRWRLRYQGGTLELDDINEGISGIRFNGKGKIVGFKKEDGEIVNIGGYELVDEMDKHIDPRNLVIVNDKYELLEGVDFCDIVAINFIYGTNIVYGIGVRVSKSEIKHYGLVGKWYVSEWDVAEVKRERIQESKMKAFSKRRRGFGKIKKIKVA